MIRISQGWGDAWKYRGAMTWLQSKKQDSLIKDGLSSVQAREFIWYKFGWAYMRRFRNAIKRGEAGATKSSAWALWRKYYNDASRRKPGAKGRYEPPKREYDPNKPHRLMDAEGNVDKKYASDYERNRRAGIRSGQTTPPKPSMNNEEWIRQLEQRIKETADPAQKEQFRRQIRNIRESSR